MEALVRKLRHARRRTKHAVELLEARLLLSSITGVSDPFSVTDQLVFTASPPANVKVGQPFSATVEAQDGNGVLDTAFNGKVTLSDHYSDYYWGTLDGTLTANAVNGVATFTGISQEMPTSQTDWVEGDKLFANSGKLPQGVSKPFNIYTDTLAFLTQPPSVMTAGDKFTVEVEALDGSGKLDPDFAGKVTMSNRYWFQGTGLQGDLTVKAVGGIATFSNISDTLATTDDLGRDGLYAYGFWEGMPNAYSNPFTVNPAAASQLVFSSSLADSKGSLLPNEPLSIEVTAEDRYGNVATGFGGDISLELRTNPSHASLGGTTKLAADHGVAKFDDVTIDKTGAGYTLVASGAGTVTSDAFDVRDQLVFATQPKGHVLADDPFSVVVKAEDGGGNVDSSFEGNVTLSDTYSYDGGTLSGILTVDAVNGVATFSNISQSLKTGDAYGQFDQLQANGSLAMSAWSNPFAVIEADGDMLSFSTQPPDTVAPNSPFRVVVTALDSSGQVDQSFNGTVTLMDQYQQDGDGPLSGTTSVDAVNGVATFTDVYQGETTNYANEQDLLYASADNSAPASSTAFSVVSGDQFRFTPDSSTYGYNGYGYNSVYAGQPFSAIVSAEDASGNVDTSFNGPVTITDLYSDEYPNAALSGTLTVKAVHGVAKFDNLIQNAVTDRADIYDNDVLFARGSGFAAGTSAWFDVLADNSQQLVFVTQPPPSVAAGETFSASVALEDASGNVVKSFDGDVTIAVSGDSTLSGTLNVKAVDGVATFTGLSDNTVTNSFGIDLIASAQDLIGYSNSFVINSGQVTQLAFDSKPADPSDSAGNALLNAPLTVTVEAEDSQGNVVDSFAGDISVSIASGPNGATLGGTTTVAAVGGVATFNNITLDTRGDYTLAAAGPASATSDSFTISDQLVFTTQPPTVVKTNEPFTVVVKAEDGLGVVDSTMSGDVTLSNEYGSYYYHNALSGAQTVKAVNGVATFTGISETAAIGEEFLLADGDGLIPATSDQFAVEADQMVFKTEPASATAGQPFDATVEIDNPTGGIDTSFNGKVTLSDEYSNYEGQSSQLKGTLTVNAVNGIATFTGISQGLATETVSYDDSLWASADGLNTAYSDSFTIAAGAAAKLAFVGVPTDTNGDGGAVANSKLSVRVVAQDAYGNFDGNFNGKVTVTLGTNPTGASLGGTTTMNITSGITDFNDLTISAVGDGYTLIANTDGNDAASAGAAGAMRLGHL